MGLRSRFTTGERVVCVRVGRARRCVCGLGQEVSAAGPQLRHVDGGPARQTAL